MTERGGKRPGAGRKPGSITRRTQEVTAKALEGGITPLDYLLSVMRDDQKMPDVRLDAAKAAAPYVHPRLAAIEHSGGIELTHEVALDELE